MKFKKRGTARFISILFALNLISNCLATLECINILLKQDGKIVAIIGDMSHVCADLSVEQLDYYIFLKYNLKLAEQKGKKNKILIQENIFAGRLNKFNNIKTLKNCEYKLVKTRSRKLKELWWELAQYKDNVNSMDFIYVLDLREQWHKFLAGLKRIDCRLIKVRELQQEVKSAFSAVKTRLELLKNKNILAKLQRAYNIFISYLSGFRSQDTIETVFRKIFDLQYDQFRGELLAFYSNLDNFIDATIEADFLVDIFESIKTSDHIIIYLGNVNAINLRDKLIKYCGFELEQSEGVSNLIELEDRQKTMEYEGFEHAFDSQNLFEMFRIPHPGAESLVKLDEKIKPLEKQMFEANNKDIVRLCSWCNKGNCAAWCSRCKSAYYCDRNCQSNHWIQGHKKECDAIINSRMQD